MDNKTIGIVTALAGVVSFFYSFSEAAQQSKIYFYVGIVLMIGGLLFAKYAKK